MEATTQAEENEVYLPSQTNPSNHAVSRITIRPIKKKTTSLPLKWVTEISLQWMVQHI